MSERLTIEETIEWALSTSREKLMFGLPPLQAALARENRIKGVLIDCKNEIARLKQEIETLKAISSDAIKLIDHHIVASGTKNNGSLHSAIKKLKGE